jgi:phenol 2-monooxygenase (NADPH)
MRLADTLLHRGVRVYDISFWRSTRDEPLHRLGREVHYPPIIDVLDPYILLVHQGMVEGIFIDDLKQRGVEVRRNTAFESYNVPEDKSRPLQVNCRANVTQDRRSILTQYLIGCKSWLPALEWNRGANMSSIKATAHTRKYGRAYPMLGQWA